VATTQENLPRTSLKLSTPDGDNVVIFRDELDNANSFIAFDRVVRIVTEATEVDTRRIDLEISKNGWSSILWNSHFGKAEPVEQNDDDSDV
jgi:hypothetical protein